ncbi:MAG: tRNA 2-selenouridine(34) synthase MnmH [Facklamia hominis]|uniref:tRNA 2-selenouridine(34) synthase MnmH n=1 Tax=Facklamia hominis TaxID=178214 RepID=UPI000C7A223E|nr:tRNA 2-selenouridine(34) synthase MnmH [Facklamia hominis]PKY93267.1 tRNA 2-selenouridine(34) synthase MnmH [Facklamia hominis]
MVNKINYLSLQSLDHPLLIDVRSPFEFEQGHISGAINLPVLDNESRQDVGRLYRHVNPEAAKLRGMEYMAQNLPKYFKRFLELQTNHTPVFYCKSGGFRSSAIVGLLDGIGEKVYQLEGGYKAYRQHLMTYFDQVSPQINFVALDGLTGCGKSLILKEIQRQGGQIIDLESLANHRGSHFGHVGLGKQPSQQSYESRLAQALSQLQPGYVFIEGESASIGKVHSPQSFYNAYKDSPHQVFIEANLEKRIQILIADYLPNGEDNNLQEIMDALQGMNKMNPQRKAKHLQALEQGDYTSVIQDLMLNYYDQHYTLINRHFEHRLIHHHPEQAAQQLLTWYP